MTVIRSGMIMSMMCAAFLISACASQETQSPSGMGGEAAASSARQVPANPLQDCLSRIPKDATAGQRSVAEQTCARDFGGKSTNDQPAASGTQGDTLQACMNRIPSDASTGQRMIAEQSCKRDEVNRRSVEAVPGSR